MQKATRYIYLLLKNTFIISITSLVLAWLTGDKNLPGTIFGDIAFYGTMFSIFLFLIHAAILIISFLVKNILKINKYIYHLLKNIVIFSIITVLFAWLGGADSSFGIFFSGIAFYGTLASVYLFVAHVIVSIASFILKNDSTTQK